MNTALILAFVCGHGTPVAAPPAVMTAAHHIVQDDVDGDGEYFARIYDLRGLRAMLGQGWEDGGEVLAQLLDHLSHTVEVTIDTMLFDSQ